MPQSVQDSQSDGSSESIMSTSPQRILITGSSGYYGRSLVSALKQRWPESKILGLDVVAPKSDRPDHFEQCDITSPAVHTHVQSFRPDTILHLAFVVNPMRDEARMHQINVDGTRNLLAAASAARPERLMVASSATAYGAWPDNPIPLAESQPLRARGNFRYADDKVKVEALLSEFTAANPQIAVSWTRPCIIYGPGMSNFMIPIFTVPPILVLPGGTNSTIQLVHLDDVVRATLAILNAGATGPFNVAPSDWMTIRELAQLRKTVAIPAPFAVCQAVTKAWWGLRLPVFRFPSTLWNFIRYPWVVAPERLSRELDFEFQYSCRDVMTLMLQDAGKLRGK